MKRFDAIVIGAGQAGPPLVGRLTGAGMTVALVERHLFGGTCVNTGCMPTKTLVASARAAHVARRAADYGVMLEGPVRVDMQRVKARADAVVLHARAGVRSSLAKNDRCTVVLGHARFESPTTVRVGTELLSAPRVFVNVGGRARVPKMPGLEGVPFLTNTTMVALDRLPRHLAVVGGSYVGLEFAQMYRRFGSEVTLIEQASQLVTREDRDVATAVKEILESEGITVRLDAECIAFDDSRAREGVTLRLECASNDRTVNASHVLLAVGRQPNTEDLDLGRAGVAIDAKGYIVVDDELRTNVRGIWALGDCNGRGAFTHTSYNDFEIVAANVLDQDPRRLSDRIEAYALYIDPALGRAGLTEAAAQKSGRPLLVAKYPMEHVGRAIEKAETQGFMKIIVDAETEKILGAAILGIEGDEAIHGILDMMYAGATARTLRRTVGIHPTVSELIPTMLGKLAPVT